jgi:hypothetical protein
VSNYDRHVHDGHTNVWSVVEFGSYGSEYYYGTFPARNRTTEGVFRFQRYLIKLRGTSLMKIFLYLIVDAPWYVSNARRSRHIVRTICHPPKMQQTSRYTQTHENPLLKPLLIREENRRLKRNWPIDLIWGTGDSPLDYSPSRHCNNYNISL